MLILFSFAILLLFLKAKKSLIIKRKLGEYSVILGQACESRRNFYNIMEHTKLALVKLEATKNELSDMKERLNQYRTELREKLLEIRL